MTLEMLQAEMIKAMKDGNKFRKSVLSDVIAQVKKAAIDKGCRDNIAESFVDDVLLKCKKIAQEMIDTCPNDRAETKAEYYKQFDIIDEFAPKLITDEATIGMLLDSIFEEIEPVRNNRGKVMKIFATDYKGKFDMSVVNKMLTDILA
jgi:uncharacterized protein YqeY